MVERITWHIVTPEYPPTIGGVADYTANIAEALAKLSRSVHVWTRSPNFETLCQRGVTVYGLGPTIGWSALRRLQNGLQHSASPTRLLVQYVPHGYGFKGMNVLLPLWLLRRRLVNRTATDVMFHEVAYPWVRHPWRHNIIAAVNRVMAAATARSASRIFLSIPAWSEMLTGLANPRTPQIWSAVPAAYVSSDEQPVEREPGLVGHFGTYGANIAPLLEQILEQCLRDTALRFLLTGLNSDRFLAAHPPWQGRVTATGELSLPDVVRQLRRCQVVILPYPDGISTRRTSAMLALANGVPIISNRGALTEKLWEEMPVILADSPLSVGDCLRDWQNRLSELHQMSELGRHVYQDRFSLEMTIQRLREIESFGGDNC